MVSQSEEQLVGETLVFLFETGGKSWVEGVWCSMKVLGTDPLFKEETRGTTAAQFNI